jgi:hypothetical protein
MSTVLIWSVFPNVARALFSNGLVIGEPAHLDAWYMRFGDQRHPIGPVA